MTTTDGLMLLPSGGFLKVTRVPSCVVKSSSASAAASLSRSGSPPLLGARDNGHRVVVVIGRERARLLLREPGFVFVEEAFEHCGRAGEILREPSVVAFHPPLGAAPENRTRDRPEPGNHPLLETRL